MTQSEPAALLKQLAGELDNFEDIARYLLPQPGEIPLLAGVDIYGRSLALNGRVGGDHLIYVDFKQRFDLEARIQRATEQNRFAVVENLRRCQTKAGIVLIDVAGHRVTDALLAAMLHQAFLLGSTYELDMFGQITRRLFENLNTRFYHCRVSTKLSDDSRRDPPEQSMFRFLQRQLFSGLLANTTGS